MRANRPYCPCVGRDANGMNAILLDNILTT